MNNGYRDILNNGYRDISDEEIKASAQRLVDCISEKYSADENSVSPSPELWDKIRQSIDKNEKKKRSLVWIGRLASVAAVFCILMVGAFQGLVGNVSAELQDWRFKIIKNDGIIEYNISSTKTEFDEYKLNVDYIPEGYTLTKQFNKLKGKTLIYLSNNIELEVSIYDVSTDTSFKLLGIDEEKTQVLEINGIEAYCYKEKKSEYKTFVMVDTDKKVMFKINTLLENEEIIKIAQSMSVE